MRADQLTREQVVEAALLHDIGKVIQRTLKDHVSARGSLHFKTHQELGYEWGKEIGLSEPTLQVILRHHKLHVDKAKYEHLSYDRYRGPAPIHNLIRIIYEADHLSSVMERLESGMDTPKQSDPYQGMGVIFDRIVLNDGRKTAMQHVWSADLIEERPYPVAVEDTKETNRRPAYYDRIWNGLRDALRHPHNRQEDRLLLLLEKYLSVVPETTLNADDHLSDISLYHHLKTAAAIASSLFVYMQDQKLDFEQNLESRILDRHDERYLLVAADLSGIQDFVYTIGSKAALKTLRARSFYLDLLLESAAIQLLERLGLGRVHLVYATGGAFLLFVPNTARIQTEIRQFHRTFNRWLYEQFRTKLYLALDFVALCGEALAANNGAQTLSGALREVFGGLGLQKTQKWRELITEDEHAVFMPVSVTRECVVCRSHASVARYEIAPLLRRVDDEASSDEETHELCTFCAQMVELGRVLPRANVFYECRPGSQTPRQIFPPEHQKDILQIEIEQKTYVIAPADVSPERLTTDVVAEYKMREPWSLSEQGTWAVRPFPTGAYLAEPEFLALAQKASGDARLGVLVMDVDRLGTIFSRGLTPSTLARLGDLSSRLNLFFKYYLPAYFETAANGQAIPQEKRLIPSTKATYDVNLVYAGGDDLLLVGTWNSAFDAAFAVWDEFRRFVGGNPDMTLSAGIAVVDERLAFYRAAAEAADAERQAKTLGRGRLSALDITLTWSEVQKRLKVVLHHFGRGLEQSGTDVRPSLFSMAFFHRYSELIERYHTNMDENRLWFVPHLHYVVGRLLHDQKDYQRRVFFKKLLDFALDETLQSGTLLLALRILKRLLKRRNAA